MDIWVSTTPGNAERVALALRDFGFSENEVSASMFVGLGQLVRLGMPPLRIEIITSVSGVNFRDCYDNRVVVGAEGVEVPVLSLEDLLANKRAAGRHKDMDDVDHLSQDLG
jgi:hypothetical protein